jgi:DNA transformation protein
VTAESSFVAFVLELFAPLGRVSARRMFSGHGLFLDGTMFGLVFREQLYLKVDAPSRPQFEALGLPPFTYERKGTAVSLSFHLAPDSVFDEPAQASHWGRLALVAALRAKAGKPARARRKPNASR